MAALTLSEKSAMTNKLSFQQRMVAAVKAKAKVFIETPIATFANYNVANQKRISYANIIQSNSSIPTPQAYSEYFLSQYNDVTPTLDENGEVADAHLTNHPAATATFDFFAGVQPGDTTKQIIL